MGLFGLHRPVIHYIFAFLKEKGKGCHSCRGYKVVGVFFWGNLAFLVFKTTRYSNERGIASFTKLFDLVMLTGREGIKFFLCLQ
jgi:hypothetical protein